MRRLRHVYADYNNGGDAALALALGQYVTALCGVRRRAADTPDQLPDGRPVPECSRCRELDDWRHDRGPARRRRGAKGSVRTNVPTFVYRCYDADGRLLYVGCTNAPRNRMTMHRKDSWWWPEVTRVRYLVFPNREKAWEQERRAILTERPRCNVKGRWHQEDPRTDWTADDYLTFRYAVVRAARGLIGTATTALLERIDAELAARFGVTAITQRSAS